MVKQDLWLVSRLLWTRIYEASRARIEATEGLGILMADTYLEEPLGIRLRGRPEDSWTNLTNKAIAKLKRLDERKNKTQTKTTNKKQPAASNDKAAEPFVEDVP